MNHPALHCKFGTAASFCAFLKKKNAFQKVYHAISGIEARG
jgi:hypothetical protein